MDDPEYAYTSTNFDYEDYKVIPFSEEKSSSMSAIIWVALVLYALAFLVGTVGNGAVIWVMGFQMKRTVNTVWFLNLSVADLLCCLSLPFLAVPLVSNYHWHLGDFACKLLPSLTILNMFASVLLLMLISIDRCALIIKPIWCQNHRSGHLAWILCGAAWFLALVLTVPSFFTRQLKHYEGSNMTSCGTNYAVFGGDYHSVEISVTVTRFLFGFLIPFVVISVCYGLLISRVHSSRFMRSKKTLKVVLVVIISFFVCWAPYHVVGLILAHESQHSSLYESVSKVDPLVVALAYINSCINPVIYVIAGQDFKDKMQRSLKAMLRNILSEEAILANSMAEGRTQATGTTTEDRSTDTTL
ncbi:C5a anaphylatoxin chemotactic receptor 1-like [Sceloporus undulatus]|uniref:C5a anaphylatoxin chemotactic receptor 1-like n=1 Tax=Sceloporus undulatus TaxID=8520 RepID=UPI001C4C74D3|nr:C5a anaphylatoxin chemotactic receptor 1-like [Sceloporus undulatus]